MLELPQNGNWLASISYSIFRRPNVQQNTVCGLFIHPKCELWVMGKFVHDGEIVAAMLDVALNRTLRERTRDTRKPHCSKILCESAWI